MQKLILCLVVIATVIAVSHAYPSEQAASTGLEDSFSAGSHQDVHEQDGLSHAEEDSQDLNRQKRQFFGGYGGYGGYGFRRRGFYGGYGGYGGFRRGFGGYGGYGFYG